jgi:hypothetical protein
MAVGSSQRRRRSSLRSSHQAVTTNTIPASHATVFATCCIVDRSRSAASYRVGAALCPPGPPQERHGHHLDRGQEGEDLAGHTHPALRGERQHPQPDREQPDDTSGHQHQQSEQADRWGSVSAASGRLRHPPRMRQRPARERVRSIWLACAAVVWQRRIRPWDRRARGPGTPGLRGGRPAARSLRRRPRRRAAGGGTRCEPASLGCR